MGTVQTVAYGVAFVGSTLAWIVLLAGISSVYGACEVGCMYYFGLSWWAVWFQLLVLLATIPVGALGMRSWKGTVLALLAVNTSVCMNQCDGFFGTKMTDPYWNALPDRMNTSIAGFILVSIFNLLLIISVGAVEEQATKVSVPQQPSAYSNSAPAGAFSNAA